MRLYNIVSNRTQIRYQPTLEKFTILQEGIKWTHIAIMSDFVLIKCISSESPYQRREKRKAVSD